MSTTTAQTTEERTTQALDTKEVWRTVLAAMSERVPEPSFRTWLVNTQLHGITPIPNAKSVKQVGVALATVAVPSRFAAEWLLKHYSATLADVLKLRLGYAISIMFKVEAAPLRRAVHALDGIGQHSEERQHQDPMPISREVGQSTQSYWSASSTSGVSELGSEAANQCQEAISTLNSNGTSVTAYEGIHGECMQAPLHGDFPEQGKGTDAVVQDMLRGFAEISCRYVHGRYTHPERIIDQVASYFSLEIRELCSASRERGVMLPRQIAMYLIREETDESYVGIARRLARQDHTTAMHSCAKIEALLQTDMEVRQMVLELRQMVHGEHERFCTQ